MANFYFFHPGDEVGHSAAITVSSGSEDTQYPASLLCNFGSSSVEAKPAKAASMAVDWLLTFAVAQRIDLVVLWHNFQAGLNVRFQGGTTSATTGLDAAVTIPAVREDGIYAKVFKDLTGVAGYSTTGFQYWKISVPANDVLPGLKLLCYSRWRQLTRNMRFGYHNPDLHTSIDHRTDYGLAWVYDLYAVKRLFTAQAPLTNTDVTTIRSWHRACHGHVQITSIIADPSVNDAFVGRWLNAPSVTTAQPSGLGVAVLDPTIRPGGAQNYSPVDIGFEELTAGLPEWA